VPGGVVVAGGFVVVVLWIAHTVIITRSTPSTVTVTTVWGDWFVTSHL
jgi:hypothetical protein